MIDLEETKLWYYRPGEVNAWISKQIHDGAKVLEIGPGRNPFFRSTHFIDCAWGNGYAVEGLVPGASYISCNVVDDDIPFPDKYFDYVFTSHVVEDVLSVQRVCREMSRVAKAGFVTTPSPLAEFCRGVQGAWRGYYHHNWFVYAHAGELCFLPKRGIVEVVEFPREAEYEKLIVGTPWLAHTYFPWRDELRYREISCSPAEYPRETTRAIARGAQATRDFLMRIMEDTTDRVMAEDGDSAGKNIGAQRG